MGKPFSDPRIPEWLHPIHAYDSVEYNVEKSKCGYEELVLPRLDGNQVLVLSYEAFTLPNHADRGIISDRLGELFDGRAKIYINIRNQLDQLRSLYLFQRYRAIQSLSFEKFIEATGRTR